MTKILFLDDSERRFEGFQRAHPEVVWVQTTGECVLRLSEPWDYIYLDHDLGGEIMVESGREDCGMEVIRYILEHRPEHLRRARFIVHSSNVPAAQRMVQDLVRAGYDCCYMPFTSLL